MKTGIYLTPGAARTAYYVGALHTLMTESDQQVDVIGGTSVGALNGAFAAMGETGKLLEIWKNWTTEDVMVNDYAAIIKGGFFWARNFSSNEPEYRTGVKDYILEENIRDGVTFRFNIANLTTGENRIVQYPGEDIPLQKAIMASVSVPVVFEPVEIGGCQYVDGLAIEGCLLEELVLSQGVDRAFVLGVSPSGSVSNPTKSPYRALLSASEWNQYSEPLRAVKEAEEVNEMIKSWQHDLETLKQGIGVLDIGDDVKQQFQAMVQESMKVADFPYSRTSVEIIPVMPEEPIEMWFGDFKPERSQKLIEQGRKKMLEILDSLG